jgi:hypothetical protein
MKKIRPRGFVILAALFVVFMAVAAALFFAAIPMDKISDDVLNDGGIIFNSALCKKYDEQLTSDIDGVRTIKIKMQSHGAAIDASPDENVYVRTNGLYYSLNGAFEIGLEKTGAVLDIYLGNTGFLFGFGFFVGDIKILIPSAFAGTLEIDGISGTIDYAIQNALTSLTVQISSGKFYSGVIRAQSVTLKLLSGSINAADIICGDIAAQVSGGTLTAGGVFDKIDANVSSGTLNIVAESASEITAKVSGGTVNITLPESAGFTLDYGVSGGRIKNKFNGKTYKQRGVDVIGGGEIKINVTISGGTVNIGYGEYRVLSV